MSAFDWEESTSISLGFYPSINLAKSQSYKGKNRKVEPPLGQTLVKVV